jgi:hypothetical protein
VFASDAEFIKKIFDLTAIARSDPNETSFWWGSPSRQEEDRAKFLASGADPNSDIVKRAVKLRFMNIVGLESWHLRG